MSTQGSGDSIVDQLKARLEAQRAGRGLPRFTEAEQQSVIEQIQKNLGSAAQKLAYCTLCERHNTYSVSDGFIFMPLQYTTRALDYSASGMPCVALTCRECGHTLFFNMLTLGLTWLVNRDPRI